VPRNKRNDPIHWTRSGRHLPNAEMMVLLKDRSKCPDPLSCWMTMPGVVLSNNAIVKRKSSHFRDRTLMLNNVIPLQGGLGFVSHSGVATILEEGKVPSG